ncbi:MAG: fumarylacetoacetate hydrolase family protein [Rhodospirillales bacterium]|nr:fumarylacetoacetate hydrolase family protein [Rhodospirillales bacterium]
MAGYSIFNDGSIRDWLRHTIQFCPGKNFEGTGPFGPWLMALDEFGDPYAQELTTRLNGEQVQHTSIAAMDHKIDKQIEYLSTVATLRPGDVISTGTPGGVGARREPPLWMKPGDTVSVEITGIGIIENKIEQES